MLRAKAVLVVGGSVYVAGWGDPQLRKLEGQCWEEDEDSGNSE